MEDTTVGERSDRPCALPVSSPSWLGTATIVFLFNALTSLAHIRSLGQTYCFNLHTRAWGAEAGLGGADMWGSLRFSTVPCLSVVVSPRHAFTPILVHLNYCEKHSRFSLVPGQGPGKYTNTQVVRFDRAVWWLDLCGVSAG